MAKADIGLESMAVEKDRDGYYIKRITNFRVETAGQQFVVPVEVPISTPDENLVETARLILHRILQDCLETSQGWQAAP